MTLSHLPAPAPVPAGPSYEPWEGEAAALAEAAAAGRRAAAWLRALPAAPDTALGRFLAVELPDTVEAVTASLDPADCDRRGPDGRLVGGAAGVGPDVLDDLAAVPCAVPAAGWLTPDQQMRLVAVASLVTGAVRVLVLDPGTAIRSEMSDIWAVLDHTIA